METQEPLYHNEAPTLEEAEAKLRRWRKAETNGGASAKPCFPNGKKRINQRGNRNKSYITVMKLVFQRDGFNADLR